MFRKMNSSLSAANLTGRFSDAVKQALQKAGYKYNTTASDVRQQRILDIQAKMAERAALAEQRLTNARMQAARASGTHNAAMTKENTALSSQSRIAVLTAWEDGGDIETDIEDGK